MGTSSQAAPSSGSSSNAAVASEARTSRRARSSLFSTVRAKSGCNLEWAITRRALLVRAQPVQGARQEVIAIKATIAAAQRRETLTFVSQPPFVRDVGQNTVRRRSAIEASAYRQR